MVLYKSYCYADISAVAAAIKSESFLPGFGFIDDVAIYSDNTVEVVYMDASYTPSSFRQSFPACDHLGFDNSYTGLTPADAFDLAWAVVAVLAVAFGFKILKRSF